jgi:2'-5' RNA ligase
MRLFVALDLAEDVHSNLLNLVRELRPTGADLRWVRPEGLHLTLKFIGEVPEEKRGPIEEALRAVSSPEPVELHFSGLGYFPNPRRPRVFWVGIEASANLAPLAAAVEAALAPLGIKPEKRAFVPHLTLGRFKTSNGLPRLQEKIAALPATEFGRQQTHVFHLYQSRLSPQGAQYTKLAEFPFVRPDGRPSGRN